MGGECKGSRLYDSRWRSPHTHTSDVAHKIINVGWTTARCALWALLHTSISPSLQSSRLNQQPHQPAAISSNSPEWEGRASSCWELPSSRGGEEGSWGQEEMEVHKPETTDMNRRWTCLWSLLYYDGGCWSVSLWWGRGRGWLPGDNPLIPQMIRRCPPDNLQISR